MLAVCVENGSVFMFQSSIQRRGPAPSPGVLPEQCPGVLVWTLLLRVQCPLPPQVWAVSAVLYSQGLGPGWENGCTCRSISVFWGMPRQVPEKPFCILEIGLHCMPCVQRWNGLVNSVFKCSRPLSEVKPLHILYTLLHRPHCEGMPVGVGIAQLVVCWAGCRAWCSIAGSILL